VGSFWARPKEEESGLVAVPASALAQGEGKEAPRGLDVQGVGGESGSGSGENAGLQVFTSTSGGPQTGTGGGEGGDRSGFGKPGELQIVWRRLQEQVRGGVVPPGGQTALSSGPGLGSQDSPRVSPGSGEEGRANSSSPSAP
jgi:hypothetical protein